jgi:hypothetical protein
MTTYHERFEAILPELRGIVEKMAQPFDADVEEYRDDEFGVSFLVERGGETLWVTANLDDGQQANMPETGNVVVRVDIGEESVLTIAPHNYTEGVFVPFSDDEMWENKLEWIRVRTVDVIDAISAWKVEEGLTL